MTAATARPPSRSFQRRYAAHAGLRFVTLDPARTDAPDFLEVNPLAARLLPEPVCRRHRVLPVAYEEGVVWLATPEPFDEVALDVARALAGRTVRVVVTADDDLDRALAAAFGARDDAAVEGGPRLGELLVARALVTPDRLARGLEEARRTGVRVGEALVHAGAVAPEELAPVLAQRLRMPAIELATVEPDPAALVLVPESVARRHLLVPLGLDATTLYLAVADVLDDDALAALREHTRLELRPFLAPPSAIETLQRRVHRDGLSALAGDELRVRLPDESASRVLTAVQARVLTVAVTAVVAGLVVDAGTTATVLLALATLAYLAVLAHRVGAAWCTLGRRRELAVSAVDVAALDERELPVYTVLVPLLREAAVVPQLLAGLEALDYPRAKLDVRLLCEEDDRETVAALDAMPLAPSFTVVVVPRGGPQTKARACQFGLAHARGAYVTVFVADDRPDPLQLKRALIAFARSAPRTACVQARLSSYNAGQNLLTRWSAAEQVAWSDLLLPGMAARGGVVALGGSSSHFVAERLTELLGWDPCNAAADVDLGVRLRKAGLRTVVLDSATGEQATANLDTWARRRSRWVQGCVQTWLVHMRHPVRLARQLGPRGFVSFHLVLGNVLVLLLSPLFWALTTIWFLSGARDHGAVLPGPVLHLAALSLLAGNVAFVFLHVAAALHRRAFDLVKPALLAPLYWGLMSIAAWRGVAQLVARPSR